MVQKHCTSTRLLHPVWETAIPRQFDTIRDKDKKLVPKWHYVSKIKKHAPQGGYPLKLGKFALLVALAVELAFELAALLEADPEADLEALTLAEVDVSLGADSGGGVNDP